MNEQEQAEFEAWWNTHSLDEGRMSRSYMGFAREGWEAGQKALIDRLGLETVLYVMFKDNPTEEQALTLGEWFQRVQKETRPEKESIVDRALKEAFEFFVHRDKMNARVHLSEIRWSPITDLVSQGIQARAVEKSRERECE